MPKEYEHCKESYLKKGVDEKKAKAICAGMYYNRHGITVNEAKKRGIKSMLFFGRTKRSLKSILESNGQKESDYVIFEINDALRKNKTLKSLFPKLEDTSYTFVAIKKSLLDFTSDGKVVLSLEKILAEVKESEQGDLNKDNVAHTEGAFSAVVEGKLVEKTPSEKQSGKLHEEIKYEDVKTKSMSSQDDLSSVLEKLKAGEKLSKEEKLMLYGYLHGLVFAKLITQDEAESVKTSLESGEKVSDELLSKLDKNEDEFVAGEPVEGTSEQPVVVEVAPEQVKEEEKQEEKALDATSVSSEALEKEDLEDDVVSLVKNLLASTKSLSSEDYVFTSKQDAVKFARMYNLYVSPKTGKQAVVKSANVHYQRLHGSKAKFVVELE